MDSRTLIGRAIHADNTDQPRLAELYMRRARQVLAEEIREQRRQRSALSFTQALIVARLNRATQADYALIAGPSKTGGETP